LVPNTAASYVDNSVTAGTTYYYRVRAEGESSYSLWSSTASIKAVSTPPAVPTNFRATTAIQFTAILAWNEVTPPMVNSFTIQRSTSNAFPNDATTTTITGISGANRTYVMGGLTRNTQYYLRIAAVGAGGTSAWSATLSMKTAP
jgi:hypothetical protein